MLTPDLLGTCRCVLCKWKETLVLDSKINDGCHREGKIYIYIYLCPVCFERVSALWLQVSHFCIRAVSHGYII